MTEQKRNEFHDHLDTCFVCRESPFELCETGRLLLLKQIGSRPAFQFLIIRERDTTIYGAPSLTVAELADNDANLNMIFDLETRIMRVAGQWREIRQVQRATTDAPTPPDLAPAPETDDGQA